MGFWDFLQTEDGHWQWRYLGDEMGSCRHGDCFRSRNDCIADAMRHGYLSEPDTDGRFAGAAERQNLQSDAGELSFLHRLLHPHP